MMDIDKSINIILGKKKKGKNSNTDNMFKMPKMSFGNMGLGMGSKMPKMSFGNMGLGMGSKMPKMGLGSTSKKVSPGASLGMQQKWKQMPVTQKATARILQKDTDRDRVPNKYDCQPRNPRMQDNMIAIYASVGRFDDGLSMGNTEIVDKPIEIWLDENYADVEDTIEITTIDGNKIYDFDEFIIGVGKNEKSVQRSIAKHYVETFISAVKGAEGAEEEIKVAKDSVRAYL